MKIYIDQIGPEGLIVHETTDPGKLDLGTEVAEFYSPLTIEARLERVDNVVKRFVNRPGQSYLDMLPVPLRI